jgi:hypothetical protein
VIGRLREVEAFATGREVAGGAADPRSAVGDDPLAAWRAARADMMAVLGPAALASKGPGGARCKLTAAQLRALQAVLEPGLAFAVPR